MAGNGIDETLPRKAFFYIGFFYFSYRPAQVPGKALYFFGCYVYYQFLAAVAALGAVYSRTHCFIYPVYPRIQRLPFLPPYKLQKMIILLLFINSIRRYIRQVRIILLQIL